LKIEIRTIKLIGRYDLGKGPLTNLTAGGDGSPGYKYTDEQRKNRSINNPFKGKHHSKKTKNEHSKKMKGRLIGSKNPMYGKTPHDVWIEKYGKEYADAKWLECIGKIEQLIVGNKMDSMVRNTVKKQRNFSVRKNQKHIY
jgi:hypothetical protein